MKQILNKIMIAIMILFFSSCSSTTHLAEKSDYLSDVLFQLKENGDIEIKMPPAKPMSESSETALAPVINGKKLSSFVSQSYQLPLVATSLIPFTPKQTSVNLAPSLKEHPSNINIKSVGNVKNQINNQLPINIKLAPPKRTLEIKGLNSRLFDLNLETVPEEFRGKLAPHLSQ